MDFSYLGDVVGGFQQETDRIRQRNQQQADLQAQRDNAIFSALANSDDADIRAAAVTGLLTQNHPARAFDKFLGRTAEHPAYTTIKALVAGGHQPFAGQTQEEINKAAAGVQGKVQGIHTGILKSGLNVTPEEEEDMVRGALGAPRRPPTMEYGTITHSDGSTVAGVLNRSTGEYINSNTGQVDYDAKTFTHSGNATSGVLHNPNPGGHMLHVTGGDFIRQFPEAAKAAGIKPTDYVSANVTPDGKLFGQPVVTAAPPLPPPALVQTPDGLHAYGRPDAAGNVPELNLPPSGAGSVRPETPAAYADRLGQLIARIDHDIPEPPSSDVMGNLASRKADRKTRRDAMAKTYGFKDYDDLQAKWAAAVGNVGAATPGVTGTTPATTPDRSRQPSQAPGTGGPAGGGPAGGGPAAAPATPPPAAPGAAGAPAAAPGADPTDPLGWFR